MIGADKYRNGSDSAVCTFVGLNTATAITAITEYWRITVTVFSVVDVRAARAVQLQYLQIVYSAVIRAVGAVYRHTT